MKPDEILKLIQLMEEKGLSEIEVKTLFKKIRICRPRPGSAVPIPAAPPPAADQVSLREAKKEERARERALYEVKSPIVGTFYRSPSPGAPPYVEVGDLVKRGQVLCIVEAMKVMNEIESEVAGRVVEIPVEDGQPVEFGQVLFRIEPQS